MNTKGPWEVSSYQGKRFYVQDTFDRTVCKIITQDNALDNATLIAAAPEMLEALIELQKQNDLYPQGWHVVGDVIFIGSETYVIVNRGGTLENLPKIGWLWKLLLFWKTRNGDVTIDEIRSFCRKHKRGKP